MDEEQSGFEAFVEMIGAIFQLAKLIFLWIPIILLFWGGIFYGLFIWITQN